MKNALHDAIRKLDFPALYGQKAAKQQVKSALLMKRHLILVGPPGVGKTTLAQEVAGIFGTSETHFVRVQGSPDLTAEDLIGDIDPAKAIKYGPTSKEAFVKGKIFKAHNGVLFFDEINRCSEKLQNALLQALEERKVTIGSYDVDFPADFIFIGTMNPEDTSTEPLSDVFLDRFDLVSMDYPETLECEQRIVKDKGTSLVAFPDSLLHYVLDFVRRFRDDERVEKKPSVRASLGIYERAQSNASLDHRDEVSFEDVKAVLVSVLAHRIALKPSLKYLSKPEDFVEEEFEKFSKKKGGYL